MSEIRSASRSLASCLASSDAKEGRNVQPQPTTTLHPDFLEANRAGHLGDVQLERLRAYDRDPARSNLRFAALLVVVAVVLFASHSPGRNAWARPFLGAAALAGAGWLLLRSRGIGGRLAHDLDAGRVESAEGAILKDRSSVGGGGRSATVYTLEVGGQRFSVARGTYDAAPEGGIVRLYYLPRSRHVVNLERLPDRPLPEGALQSPLDMLKSVGPALLARDHTARAEARATLAAMESAMELQRTAQATPPPAAARDPRPLAEAILGRWHTGPFDLEFAADGSLAAKLLGEPERRARWSVEADGRLRSDATGQEQVGEAWVVGDTLTIVADGQALTFRRA